MLHVPHVWRLLWLYLPWQQPGPGLFFFFSTWPKCPNYFQSPPWLHITPAECTSRVGVRGEGWGMDSKCFVTIVDNCTSCWIVSSWLILEVPIKTVCNLPASHSLIVPSMEQVAFVKGEIAWGSSDLSGKEGRRLRRSQLRRKMKARELDGSARRY